MLPGVISISINITVVLNVRAWLLKLDRKCMRSIMKRNFYLLNRLEQLCFFLVEFVNKTIYKK